MTRSSVAAHTDTLTSVIGSSRMDEIGRQNTSSMSTGQSVSEAAASKQESGASWVDKTGTPSTSSPITGKSFREAATAKHEYINIFKTAFKNCLTC